MHDRMVQEMEKGKAMKWIEYILPVIVGVLAVVINEIESNLLNIVLVIVVYVLGVIAGILIDVKENKQ